MINFGKFDFAPVVKLPEQYQVRDFRTRGNANRAPSLPYSIGRYDEDRVGMYEHDLFEGRRTVHVGIEVGAPAHTPVYAFWEGLTTGWVTRRRLGRIIRDMSWMDTHFGRSTAI